MCGSFIVFRFFVWLVNRFVCMQLFDGLFVFSRPFVWLFDKLFKIFILLLDLCIY